MAQSRCTCRPSSVMRQMESEPSSDTNTAEVLASYSMAEGYKNCGSRLESYHTVSPSEKLLYRTARITLRSGTTINTKSRAGRNAKSRGFPPAPDSIAHRIGPVEAALFLSHSHRRTLPSVSDTEVVSRCPERPAKMAAPSGEVRRNSLRERSRVA